MRTVNLRVVTMMVADGDLDLLMASTAMLGVLASNCEERLRTLHEWWSLRAPPTIPGRSAESFTDDELRGSLRFGRHAIAELLGLLRVPNVPQPATRTRFASQVACLLLLRRLGECERVFGTCAGMWSIASCYFRNV